MTTACRVDPRTVASVDVMGPIIEFLALPDEGDGAPCGRFFRDIGTPAARGAAPMAPSGETIRRFLDTARRYGYWNASPEENARLGLVPPLPR